MSGVVLFIQHSKHLQILADKPQFYFYYIFDIIFPFNEPTIHRYNNISFNGEMLS